MKTDIWMPIYIGDYLKDTRHLTTEEHGAYILILMELWNKGGSLKKQFLPRIAPVDGDFFRDLWPAISEFFDENGEGIIEQKRLSQELESSVKRRMAAAENGRKGGRPKTQQEPIGLPIDNPDHNPGAKPGETSSPSPSKASKEKHIKFDFDYVWKRYPNKDGKKDALRHFNATVKTEKDYMDISRALDNYLESEKVKSGFIKNGSTWFNNWQDWINWKEPKGGERGQGRQNAGARPSPKGKYAHLDGE